MAELEPPFNPYDVARRLGALVTDLGGTARRVARIAREDTGRHRPEPPAELPVGYLIDVPGRGEMFCRDTGGEGPTVLLLHGWMVSGDLNWFGTYRPLQQAGYRVIAIDHRGHGRGLRGPGPFRLEECARDAAAFLDELGGEAPLVVGYSMGGPIAQLLARERPDLVRGLVLCATAMHWREPKVQRVWKLMGALRLALGLFPFQAWRVSLRLLGFPPSPRTSWYAAELTRGASRDIAEAGRELGRFDSREWVDQLPMPAAVVLTTRDRDVPPAKQEKLAAALDAPAFRFDGEHGAVVARAERFAATLVQALDDVRDRSAGQGAGGRIAA